jgi:hypothetical protein
MTPRSFGVAVLGFPTYNNYLIRNQTPLLTTNIAPNSYYRCIASHRPFSFAVIQVALHIRGPPLWSSGQKFLTTHPEARVRFPVLPDFLRSGSGTGSTQHREYNWGATWSKRSGSCLENRLYGRRDPSRWPRGTLYPQKLAITSTTSGDRSVGIVRLRTQTTEFVCSTYQGPVLEESFCPHKQILN